MDAQTKQQLNRIENHLLWLESAMGEVLQRLPEPKESCGESCKVPSCPSSCQGDPENPLDEPACGRRDCPGVVVEMDDERGEDWGPVVEVNGGRGEDWVVELDGKRAKGWARVHKCECNQFRTVLDAARYLSNRPRLDSHGRVYVPIEDIEVVTTDE